MTISRSFTARFSRVAVAAGGLWLLFASCDPVNPYPEYVGVNLLVDRGITPATATAGYLDGPLPGFAFDYIELTELLPAEYGTAPPGGGAVYRLEMLNLLPDGDFEASATGATPGGGVTWVFTGPPPDFAVDNLVVAGVPGFGTGNYLKFNVSPVDTGSIDLGTDLADELVGDGVYHIQFDVVRETLSSPIVLDYGEGTTSYLEQDSLSWTFGTPDVEQSDTPVQRFPDPGTAGFEGPGTFYASPMGTGSLFVGSPKAQSVSEGYVDNIRIGRIDVLPHWAFALPAISEGDLELVPGRYRFRVRVKSEISTQVTPEPAGWNRFRAGQITIGVNNQFSTYRQIDHQWDSSTWVEITHEFMLTPAAITQSPALTIQITPSSLDTPAVGSILISSPILELAY